MNQSTKRKIFAISGSTRKNSSNVKILHAIAGLYRDLLDVEVFDKIGQLPHFNPDLADDAPEAVREFRKSIDEASGVLICTPEYVFSLPGSLKNALEWTVSTMIFSNKPVAFIVASAGGSKAFESLDLIMATLTQTSLIPECKLLIPGGRSKVNENGEISDATLVQIRHLIDSLITLIDRTS